MGSSSLTGGLTPGPLHWECRVLATAPPEKSLYMYFKHYFTQPILISVCPFLCSSFLPVSVSSCRIIFFLPENSRSVFQCRCAGNEFSQFCLSRNVSFAFKKCSIVLVVTTASADSAAATVDSETITLNSGTLQTFEILPVSNYFKKPYDV